MEKDEKRFQFQMVRQNKLLHTTLHVLLNLAENVNIEKKMVNRQLPLLLVLLLDRSMDQLLFVALTFLKKLSIFQENKNQMASAEIVPKLVQKAFLPDFIYKYKICA